MRLNGFLSVYIVLAYVVIAPLQADELVIRNPSEPLVPMVVKGAVEKSVAVKQGELVLSSIFIGFGKKIATINDKEYQEGDSFGRYLVKAINSDHVVIDGLGKTKVLALYAVNKTGFKIK